MTLQAYHKNIEELQKQAKEEGVFTQWARMMCKNDLFYLLVYILDREDLDHIVVKGKKVYRQWLFDRCNEVQENPDGYMDIWFRDGYKSTIITFAKTIQDILINPDITVCIYSYSSALARKFLKQIKDALESKRKLINLFPEILFDDINKPSWQDENGDIHQMVWSTEAIKVKRNSSAKENTVEASGLVIGQKTGGHYNLLIYDDVVTPDSVTTSDMIQKTTKQYEMSLNTVSSGDCKIRMVGTFYHYNDTYCQILEKKGAKLRLYSCIGEDGKPVLYEMSFIQMKKRIMSTAIFAAQMLCDPKANSKKAFEKSWIRFWIKTNYATKNIFIIVDPANKKKRVNDYTCMWVVGCGEDKNYYILDLVRDKMELTERTKTLFNLVRSFTYNNQKPPVFYEEVAMGSDTSHINFVMEVEDYRFEITPVKATTSKESRIGALEPLFRSHRIWFPQETIHMNWKGEEENMIKTFVEEEYSMYPLASHDDGLDSLSRIADKETGQNMYFPDMLELQQKERMMLEERGFKFRDVEDAKYSAL